MAANPEYPNTYGRRGGRGVRPWLLMPKVVFAAVFVGGLVNLLVLGFLLQSPASAAEWGAQAELIRLAYARIVVPGLIGTLLTGVLLLLTHPGVFLRMRWLKAKLALVIVFVPTFHFFMSSRSIALREAIGRGDLDAAGVLREQLFRGTMATAVFALAVMLLGRLKPRLGQNYGRTFASKRGEA